MQWEEKEMRNRKFLRRIRTLTASVALMCAITTGVLAQTIYFAAPGGATEDRYKKFVIPAFEKLHNAKVQYVAATTGELLAKLEAQRNNQDFDVISLSDGVMLQAEERGFCAPLVEAPVYSELIPEAKLTKNSIGVYTTYSVIAVNEKMLADKSLPVPQSWLDLGNPKYEGEMALLSIGSSTSGLHGLVMVARANGGNESNIDPGFTYFKDKIRPNLITVVQSTSKLSEMLQTGEVAIGVVIASRASALAASGIPIKSIVPKEGAPMVLTAVCPVQGSDQPDLAQKFIQFLVSAEGQKGFDPGDTPVNKGAPQTTEGQLPKFVKLDWGTINKQRDAWIDRWNREIER